MKFFAFFTLALAYQFAFGSIQMPRIDPSIFIPNCKTDFSAIASKNEKEKEVLVKKLFDLEMIDHFLTKSYDLNAKFSDYYTVFSKNYLLIDLNNDGVNELVFSGRVTQEVESEQLSIFQFIKNNPTQIYIENGHLLAYQIHPNTKEILLFHHQYPCCDNASHNLNRLRLVNGKMQLLKRYFVGRDSGMKGEFFPKKTTFSNHYLQTKREKTELRWSPEVITKNAWERRSENNVIALYPIRSYYKVLAKNGKWRFVLMQNAPVIQQNLVINPRNFSNTWIYGWIEGG